MLMISSILPVLKRNISHSQLVMSFAGGLLSASDQGNIPVNVANSVFKDIVIEFAAAANLTELDSAQAQRSTSGYAYNSLRIPSTRVEPDTEGGKLVASFLVACHRTGLENELHQISSKLCQQASIVNTDRFEILYLPTLSALISTQLPDTNQSLESSHALKSLCRRLLTLYLVRYVKEEPQRPLNWSRLPLRCYCEDCQQMNGFVIDPTLISTRFQAVQQRRTHMIHSLGNDYDIITDKRGSPHTEVITKTDRAWKTAHDNWVTRRNRAKQQITMLSKPHLQRWLGDQHQALLDISIDVVKTWPSVSTVGSSTLAPLSQSGQNRLPERELEPPSRRKVPQPRGVIVIDD